MNNWRVALRAVIAEALRDEGEAAKAANLAKSRTSASDPGLRTVCESCESPADIRKDSQRVRKPETRASLAFSQDSQASQWSDPPRAGERAGAAVTEGCATCAHRTRAGGCGEPALAGLSRHFAIRWHPNGGVGCRAWRARPELLH
jgi:hypothetical protein